MFRRTLLHSSNRIHRLKKSVVTHLLMEHAGDRFSLSFPTSKPTSDYYFQTHQEH